jgi:hypothetical protein
MGGERFSFGRFFLVFVDKIGQTTVRHAPTAKDTGSLQAPAADTEIQPGIHFKLR